MPKKVTKKNNKFTPQFRKKVVLEIENGDKTFSEIVREYNLNQATLCRWLKIYRTEGLEGLAKLNNSGRKKGKLYKKRGQEILEKKKKLDQNEQIRLLKMENEYYKKMVELLTEENEKKKEPSNKQKAKIIYKIKEEHRGYKIRELLKIAGLKRSTYYEIINKKEEDKYKRIKEKIIKIYEENNGIYGYRRIKKTLEKEEIKISKKLVLKLMNELGIRGKRSNQKSKYNSYPGEKGQVVENLLERDFKAGKENEKWVTDISEFKINGEKLYLSPLLDLYNDEIISYELTKSPTIEVVKRMVSKGKRRLKEGENPILHTDQGCQYRSASYQKYLKENNIRPSMSKKGTCLDNAKAENLFSIIKNEFYYIQKFKDEKDFRKKLDVYIKYYNEKRIKERLNWMSPVEYRNTAPLVA